MQITLDPVRRAAVQRKAESAGISIAEYVRRLIDADVGPDARKSGDVSAIFNLGNSGGSDISRHKDEYIGEAIDQAHPRRE